MNNKIKLLSLVLAVLFYLPALAACGESKTEDNRVTRMTVDINPSVEFIVDSEGKVVTATALNDDGAVVMSGEVFVGKTADEAACLFVSIATDQGYLVQGSVESTENQITVSVTGNDDAVQSVYDKTSKKVNAFIESEKLNAALVKAEAIGHEALAEMAAHCTAGLEYEEALDLSDDELLRLIKLSRIETAEIASAELREYYYELRDYKLQFAESEAMLAAIENVDSGYQQIVDSYRTVIKALEDAIAALEKVQNDYLLSEDSSYQKSLQTVMEKKAEYLRKKAEVDALSDGTEKNAALLVLQTRKSSYEAAEAALKLYYEVSNTSIEIAKNTLVSVVDSMKEQESNFPEEIKTVLSEKSVEIENSINSEKDAFFAEFEAAHKDDIAAYDQMIADIKAKYSTTSPSEES